MQEEKEMNVATALKELVNLFVDGVQRCQDYLKIDFEDELTPLKELQWDLVILIKESTPTVYAGVLSKIRPFNDYEGASIDFVDYTGRHPVSLIGVNNYILTSFTPALYLELVGLDHMQRMMLVLEKGVHWRSLVGEDKKDIPLPLMLKSITPQNPLRELENLKAAVRLNRTITVSNYNWDTGASGMSEVTKSL